MQNIYGLLSYMQKRFRIDSICIVDQKKEDELIQFSLKDSPHTRTHACTNRLFNNKVMPGAITKYHRFIHYEAGSFWGVISDFRGSFFFQIQENVRWAVFSKIGKDFLIKNPGKMNFIFLQFMKSKDFSSPNLTNKYLNKKTRKTMRESSKIFKKHSKKSSLKLYKIREKKNFQIVRGGILAPLLKINAYSLNTR